MPLEIAALFVFAQAGTGRLGITICGGKGAVFAGVLLLTGKALTGVGKCNGEK